MVKLLHNFGTSPKHYHVLWKHFLYWGRTQYCGYNTPSAFITMDGKSISWATLVLHQSQCGLEQCWSYHLVPFRANRLRFHHYGRTCKPIWKLSLLLLAPIPLHYYNLECVCNIILDPYKYTIMCKCTHVLNILPIQVPLEGSPFATMSPMKCFQVAPNFIK